MAATANPGYRSYGSSSLVQPQEQYQNQFVQPEYYSTATASSAAAGMLATTTASPQYQTGHLGTGTNVYLPSLPPLAQNYSYQNYNNNNNNNNTTTSTAGSFNTVPGEPSQPVQQV